MGTLRKLQRGLDPYRQALAMAKKKKQEEAWALLPTDPLLEQKAPENNYPENQGMGNAFKESV